MKLKNILFEQLAQSGALGDLESISSFDTTLSWDITELYQKICELEKPYFRVKQKAVQEHCTKADNGNFMITDAFQRAMNELCNMEVELDGYEEKIKIKLSEIPKGSLSGAQMRELKALIEFIDDRGN